MPPSHLGARLAATPSHLRREHDVADASVRPVQAGLCDQQRPTSLLVLGLDRSRCAIDSVNTRVMKGSWRVRIL
ncbi:hypothetical protein ABZZ04_29450 [Streptomyces sp. NPDC006435]|uniref:hypothetical protein n=1 Tax=Streptomyces sp. NPDC006435 TaxID=3154300 RepID=UPI0033A654DD